MSVEEIPKVTPSPESLEDEPLPETEDIPATDDIPETQTGDIPGPEENPESEEEYYYEEEEDDDDFEKNKHMTNDKDGRRLSAKTSKIIKKVRGTWGNKIEYFVSSVGMAVGLGNLWRFPYVCQRNGGGVFIIPFFLISLILGFPCFLLECSVGQYFQAGILSLWKICPLLKGVGYLTFFVVYWTSSYYMVILAWITYYMCSSITIHELPWETCNNSWNTKKCSTMDCSNDVCNSTDRRTPADEYWQLKVTGKSEDLTKIGSLQWYLLGLLALLWICSYLCLFRGIQWLGKIITFIMLFPCVIIVILLIRSAFLPGSAKGILYLIKPTFAKLIEAQVWFEAASQVFFSYSVGLGAVITYSSFNDFHTDIWKLSIAVCLSDLAFSSAFALMVYAVIGFIAQIHDVDIATIGEEGPDLIFLVYPQALSLLPLAPIWAFLFFSGVLVIGLTSELALVETLICALEDEYEMFRQYRWVAIMVLCFAVFIPGILMVTEAGLYYLDFLDHYGGAGWAILTEILLELIGISYFYGAARLSDNISAMIGYPIPVIIKYLWKYVSPLFLLIILGFSLFGMQFLGKKKGFFPWVDYAGISFSFSSIVWVPGYMIYRLLRESGSCIERFQKASRPVAPVNKDRRKSNVPLTVAISAVPPASEENKSS